MILSAFGGESIKYRNAFKAPAPSKIDAGYKFIRDRRRLATMKKLFPPLFRGISSAKKAVARLKIIPPRHKRISL